MFTLKLIAVKVTALAVYVAMALHFPATTRALQKFSESVSYIGLDQIPDRYAVILAHSGVQHIVAFMAVAIAIAVVGNLLGRLSGR